ncbi:hypothetical protein [Fischerella sp. JS2]|nr:hypothetical protein [Fischerella sp. JS2]
MKFPPGRCFVDARFLGFKVEYAGSPSTLREAAKRLQTFRKI